MAHAASAHGHDEHTGHGGHHVIAKRDLTRTISILIGLTALTVGLGLLERHFAEERGIEIFGSFSVLVALAIAGVKAYFVAAYFMGLKYDRGTNLLAFVGSGIFLVIFLAFTFMDTLFRDTFEEQSAIPVDMIQAEALEAARQSEVLQPAFDAVPLVDEPDAQLFPGAASDPTMADPAASGDATPAIEDGGDEAAADAATPEPSGAAEDDTETE